MSLERRVTEMLSEMMRSPDFASQRGLENALRLLAKWRSQLIDNTVVARQGTVIRGGPFAGMRFVERASECNVAPRLLGSYEGELHPVVEDICAAGYERLVDIGCADGYYAVGFARRMPGLTVYAHDVNPTAQSQCAALAESNGVAGRVQVGGLFRGEDFEGHAGHRTLVFIDAEGAEDELMRPDLYPALARLSALVECHDVFKPGLSGRIAERFAATHDIRRIAPRLHCPDLPEWFSTMSHLDQVLAGWEWRMGPTPWLYMTPQD